MTMHGTKIEFLGENKPANGLEASKYISIILKGEAKPISNF